MFSSLYMLMKIDVRGSKMLVGYTNETVRIYVYMCKYLLM